MALTFQSLKSRPSFGLCLLVLLSSAVPPNLATAQDTGFDQVEVDVSKLSFNKVLPFDVWFQLHGQVPAGTESLKITFSNSDNKWASLIDPSKRGERTTLVGTLGLPLTSDAKTKGFRVMVPKLEARRYYYFEFEFVMGLTPDQLKDVKSKVLAALDVELWKQDSTMSTKAIQGGIRDALSQAIKKSVGGDFKFNPGTLFDPASRLPQPFRNTVDRVLLLQADYTDAQEDYDKAANLFQERLASLSQHNALQALDDKLQDAETTRRLRADETAAFQGLKLFRESDQLRAISRGYLPYEPKPYDPSAAPPKGANADSLLVFSLRYDSTKAKLAALQRYILQGISPQLGLSQEQLGELRTVAGDTWLPVAREDAATLFAIITDLKGGLASRSNHVVGLSRRASLQVEIGVGIPGSTLGSFKTRESWYFSVDAGVLWLPVLQEATPYFGTNVYLRPVNKNAPLSSFPKFGDSLARRFAFTFGITMSSLESENRENLFSSYNLLLGAGLRLTGSFRGGGGVVLFKEKDVVSGETSPALAGYVSVALDWDIASTFSWVGKILPS